MEGWMKILTWAAGAMAVAGCDATIHEYPRPGRSVVAVEVNVDRRPPVYYKEVVYGEGGTREEREMEATRAEAYVVEDSMAMRVVVELFEVPREGADVDEGFAIADLLALMGLDEDVRDSLVRQTEEKIQDTGISLAMAVVESVAQSILYAALFLISFVGLTILLKLLIRAMDLVLQLPGLHLVNSLGGGLIGLAEGALALFLAIWVLRRFGVSFETDTVSATHILRFFATHTPLSALSLLQ